MKYRSHGFTLIELLVVIAIVAVLAAMAVPSFNTLLVKRSVQSAASDLVSDMRLARSEALRRSIPVTVCSLAANSTSACSAANAAGTWVNGWLVFMDANADGVVDAADEIIRVQQAPSNMASILNSTPGNTRQRYTYQANGWAKAANDTLVFTPRGTVPAGTKKCVVVSITGRPSVVNSGDTGCP